MTFVENLKEKLRKHDKVHILQSVRNDPEYDEVINKLQEFIIRRDDLYRALSKTELDIDACLVLIEMKIQKREIDKTREREV